MAGHRGRHAEPGVRVDIARTDEALHQLVGDVIVFGEQLAGDIEGDRIRAVLGNRLLEAIGHQIEGLVPGCRPAVDFRAKHPALQTQRLGKRRPLRAQPAEIRRMLRIALDRDRAFIADARDHAAADAAIGTGGFRLNGHQRSPGKASAFRIDSGCRGLPPLRQSMRRCAERHD